MKKAVIALGGNALGQGLGDGRDAMERAAEGIADILEDGWDVLIVHGNGPQVGALLRAMELLEKSGENPGRATLSDCVAMSQGYIGNELQSALLQELRRRGLRREVATLLTGVEVDAEDTAFADPCKPVGMHVDAQQAYRLACERGYAMREEPLRGWRRVVPSPKPQKICECEIIRRFVDAGVTLICGGGGGIPVMCDEEGLLHPVDAVVDKDLVAARLAIDTDADVLLILTAVEGVYANYGQEDQHLLREIPLEKARGMCEVQGLSAGSMLPKVQAAVDFAAQGGQAVIAALGQAREALQGRCGTRIGGDMTIN